MLPSIIISDTSCLILLTRIGQLALLPRLCNSCYITPDIAAEYGAALPDWLHIRTPAHPLPPEIAPRALHAGERSALALARELPDSLLVLDDSPARKLASQLHLSFTGTIGLLLLAKTHGLLPAIRPLLAELRETGMWLTDEVADQVCRLAGE